MVVASVCSNGPKSVGYISPLFRSRDVDKSIPSVCIATSVFDTRYVCHTDKPLLDNPQTRRGFLGEFLKRIWIVCANVHKSGLAHQQKSSTAKGSRYGCSWSGEIAQVPCAQPHGNPIRKHDNLGILMHRPGCDRSTKKY